MQQTFKTIKTPETESLLSHRLFVSDYYEIKRWTFEEQVQAVNGYNDCFCFILVTNGEYAFDVSRKKYEMHTGLVIVEKPGFEYRLRPTSGVCTIFNFTEEFYQKVVTDLRLGQAYFFSNPNILSQLLASNPAIEYLHYQIVATAMTAGKLEMDNLVFELLHETISLFTNDILAEQVSTALKGNHLTTVERAKEYMNKNFKENISLQEIAGYCFVSPFHFSRLFKKFTSYSPYRYLLQLRLKHSEMLLRNSVLSIADIAFVCGFSSPEHFATSFKQKHKINPTEFRKI